jgi:HSP20 family protein
MLRAFGDSQESIETWSVPIDVVREGEQILVKASLPGLSPDDIQVSIEDDVLTIKGETKMERETKEGDYLLRERRSGSFYRAIRLPDTVDTENAMSSYENGVLTVEFPRLESKRARKLDINAGSKAKVLGEQEFEPLRRSPA